MRATEITKTRASSSRLREWPGLGLLRQHAAVAPRRFPGELPVHLLGRRRYATTDASRNNLLVAALTMGEGWHNNHHHYQSSANQGFTWWEIDVSFYILRAFEKLGLIWDVRVAPPHVLTRNLIADEGERCELLLAQRAPEPASHAPAPAAPRFSDAG